MKYNSLLGDVNLFIKKNRKLVCYIYNRFRVALSEEGIEEDDAIQEGLLTMCYVYEQYNGKYKLSTFAAKCLEQKYLNLLRRQSADKRKIFKYTSSLYTVIHDSDNKDISLEETIGECDDFDFLETEMCLDERSRKIVVMLKNDCTQRQISKEIGISQPQVSRIIKKIHNKLVQAV